MADSDWTFEYPLSQWVARNLDRVSDAATLPRLRLVGLEIKPGSFPIDVVAATPDHEIVVIENQLGGGDHDHFGKLLTHAAGLGAAHAVWIAEGFCDEHIYAMRMLNGVGALTLHALRFTGRAEDTIQFEAVVTKKTPIDSSSSLGEPARRKYLRIAHFWQTLREVLPGHEWHPDVVSNSCLRQAIAVPGTDIWIWIEPWDDRLDSQTQVSVWPGDRHRNPAKIYAMLDQSALREAMGGEYARVAGTLADLERNWAEPVNSIAKFIQKLVLNIPLQLPK